MVLCRGLRERAREFLITGIRLNSGVVDTVNMNDNFLEFL